MISNNSFDFLRIPIHNASKSGIEFQNPALGFGNFQDFVNYLSPVFMNMLKRNFIAESFYCLQNIYFLNFLP